MSQLDLGIIGNCQVSALLDKKAQYVWTCLPRLDGPAIFASLLGDEHNGVWSILPATNDFETKQYYARNTNVLITEFHLKSGERYDIYDFAPRFEVEDGYYRAPQFVRIVRVIKGNPCVRVNFQPRFDYGQLRPEVSIIPHGVAYRFGGESVFLKTDVPLTYVVDGSSFELSQDRYFILSHGEPFNRSLKFACEEFLDRTASYWRTWVKHCSLPFEHQNIVIRSALALKLHIFEDTGAIIAATTTSIPESPEGGRTWDYRFCWLRDAYFVINALNQLGQFEEMEKFIQFLHNIAVTEPGTDLQAVYGLAGEKHLYERRIAWLPGFKNIGPVRVGNAAYDLPQWDVYGEMVLAVMPLFFDSRFDRIDLNRAFENVELLVDRAIKSFERPDCGIWEFRGEKRHFVFSKLMSWAAVDRGLKIAAKLGKNLSDYNEWLTARDRMRMQIEAQAWNEKIGYYTQVMDQNPPAADASNLLLSTIGFHDPDHPAFISTVEKYKQELMHNGYTFRYKTDDDFGRPLHAFTICSFWMIDALSSIGRVDEAKSIFERMLSHTNHLGLLSEDVDPLTGELWGNFPQTYSHVGVINSAFKISKSWSEAF